MDKEDKNLIIGPYRLISQIGKGSSGTVYTAKHSHSEQDFCCKVIAKDSLKHSEDLKFFRREVSILSSLEHKNIVKYYELLEDDSNYFIIMEYIDGESLQAFIDKKTNLTERVIANIFYQLLEALEYVHSNNIGHRDLKPANIMLLKNSHQVKLIDFGLSTDDNDNLRHTFCGSLAFAAPECIMKEPYVAAKADIWAAGVILYYLTFGKLPWKTNNLVNMMKHITTGNFTYPGTASFQLTHFIRKMLVLQPSERPPIDALKKNQWLTQHACPKPPTVKLSKTMCDLPRIRTSKSASIPTINSGYSRGLSPISVLRKDRPIPLLQLGTPQTPPRPARNPRGLSSPRSMTGSIQSPTLRRSRTLTRPLNLV